MAYVRRVASDTHDIERAGPFVGFFSRVNPGAHFNWAMPDDAAQPGHADVAALLLLFKRRGVAPRLEFVPSAAPDVGAVLAEHGFVVEEHLPLMSATRATLVDLRAPAGVVLESPRSEAQLRTMIEVQHAGFEEPGDPPADMIDVRRAQLAAGAVLRTARDGTGAVVGAGLCSPPRGGLGEIVGVAVLPAARRRGIAGAMVAALAREAFARGAETVFLEAAPGAGGAYRRAGFSVTSSVVHYGYAGAAG